MRTKDVVAAVAVTVAAGVLAYFVWQRVRGSDEEAPIIVKNSSMDLLAGDDAPKNRHWKWTHQGGGGTPAFIHEPTYAHGNVKSGPLFVYVVGHPDGGCTTVTAGDVVTVTFTDGFSAKISRAQLGSSNQYRLRAEASSAAELSEVAGAKRPTLRHGASGSGYIASVTVGSATPCTFLNAAALTRICISPDDPTKACEE